MRPIAPIAASLALVVAVLGAPLEARAGPTTRIIVELAQEVRDEHELTAEEVRIQRARILVSQFHLAEALGGHEFSVTQRFDSLPYLALEVSDEALVKLAANPATGAILADRLMRPLLSESGPMIGHDAFASAGFDGTGTTIAIADTGVEVDHPFLAGKVIAEACFSAGGQCPGGYAQSTTPGSAAPCNYAPGCDHGTHVAGIVAGEDPSFTGIAPGAELVAIQVFSHFSGVDCEGGGSCALSYTSDLIKALEWVYDHHASYDIKAVNMSLGSDSYTDQADCDAMEAPTKAAIDNLRAVGVATIAASGNEFFADALAAPACISSAISVGAVDKSNVVPAYSNSAAFLDLLAPGDSIYSSLEGGTFGYSSGTSMATPHVAGAWAILSQKDPNASVADLHARFAATGVMTLDLGSGVTTPRIDVFAAGSGWGLDIAPAIVEVDQPSGGIFKAGDTISIEWNGSSFIDHVDVDYTLDDGATWQEIAMGNTSGSLDFPTPNLWRSANDCRVRAIAFNGDGDEVARGESVRFRIKKAVASSEDESWKALLETP